MTAIALQQDLQVVRHFVGFARVVGVLLIAMPLLVLVGWWQGNELLTAVIPGQQTMKPSTAIGFILCGIALRASLRHARALHVLGRGVSLAVFALGVANIGQYLGWLELGMDRWFRDAYSLEHGLPPGRMALATAIAFSFLGLVGLIGTARHWLWVREACAVAVLAIAMLGLASFGCVLAGQAQTPVGPLALETTILLLLGTLGWMASTPSVGFTRVATARSLGGAFARRLLLPSLLLPVAFTFSFETVHHALDLSDELALSLAALFTGGTLAFIVWWVATLLDRLERQRREAELLRDDASTDGLTLLANRRAFDEALAGLMRGRRERDAVFSLLMLDLDKFKDYNDRFGHQAGDEVLRITGRLLRRALRPTDLPARYGGEEFALLLPDTDREHAGRVAERILADFRAFDWPGKQVTISIGVAEAQPGEDEHGLVRRADEALYEAKNSGRDRAVLAAAPSTPGQAVG